ncbi:MAG: Nramp family divalent metal transporter [Candidatus Falkowbacteria bacterium]|nr:Nramp family divalent metal transporter [Candidatus Falkowbacteria bacterium]
MNEVIKKEFPKPLSLKKIIGPSFIMLAFGLGSGELILWPYLTANYGLGLVWGALVGITFQYFIDMEIERYALVKGESVFVGLAGLFKKAPYWFILSTFLGWALPGIIAAGSKSLAAVFGIANFKWLAICLLLVIGLTLSLNRTVYSLMEKITKWVILLGVAFILVMAILSVNFEAIKALGQGLIGIGAGFNFIPSGISLAVLLGAFAYAGAGGNLNLAQSIYIKEKGFGMGAYAHKMSGLFKSGKIDESFKLTGEDFEINAESIKNFQGWWKRINTEHALVFWFLGFTAMALLMLLSYSTTFGKADNAQGVNFLIHQGANLSTILGAWAGPALLFVIGILLVQTQLGVIDSTSRIMAENTALKKIQLSGKKDVNLSKIYYFFVWAQILFGILMFLFNFYEPVTLIVIGAVINAVAMIVHIFLVSYLNQKALPKIFRPKLWRRLVLGVIFISFLCFGVVTLWSNFLTLWANLIAKI